MSEYENRACPSQLLIVSQDVVSEKMAGPGIRYLEMARCLSHDLSVTLAVPAETSLAFPGLHIVRYWEDRPESLRVLVENSDIVLVSGYMILKFPFLSACRARLVVDLYDPLVFENLHYFTAETPAAQEGQNRQAVDVTNALVRIGDYFICGNERQRDLWIGVLMANGRINPRTFAQDGSLRSLIDIVGVGFPERPLHDRPFLRGLQPEVPAAARIVLWGGGIWNWLDPLTLVKAWPVVLAAHPEARLVFLGTRHPNPVVPDHEMALKTIRLAESLGEKDRSILFYDWITVEDREALLCEADVGVALHPVHIETRYSIRTRVLDYLWARLPILITDGDVTSEWVREYHLGKVVPPHDPQSVSTALIELLDQPKSAWQTAFDPIHVRMTWPQVVAPLREYCLHGQHAPDRLPGSDHATIESAAPQPAGPARPVNLAEGIRRAFGLLRSKGAGPMVRQVLFHLKWRVSRRK
jgi:glycosyltransferase involved in cell wall biosynthesis